MPRKPTFMNSTRRAFVLLGLPLVLASGCSPSSTAPVPGSASASAPAEPAPTASAPPEAGPAPSYCPAVAPGLVDVARTPAAPYFVHHPTVASAAVPTIVFIPGGPGSRETATATFELWLSRGRALGSYRIVVPYADDGDLTDESERTLAVLDEALSCYGGSKAAVHLGGTSNGGRAAFALMLAHPDRFVTLLGAPGLFGSTSDAALAAALAGKSVFNGAGAVDETWRPQVEATQRRLTGLGIDSVYVALPGQGHILDDQADQEVFFSFWAAHSAVGAPP